MKKLSLTLISLFVSAASYAEVSGTIVQFSGRKVETGKAYSYVALKTVEGSKIAIPSWLDGRALAKIKNNKVIFDAKVENVFCTDMSSACVRGSLVNIKSAKIILSKSNAKSETFSGALERHRGSAIESPKLYDYISVGSENISVPSFINAKALLKLKADMTLIGTPIYMMCTDMSDACGSTDLDPLVSIEITI